MKITNEQDILQKVIAECWKNPTFKKEFMADPQTATERLTGETFNVPEGQSLEVLDQSKPGVVYITIPLQPDMDNLELTEQQLEAVAGGGCVEEQVVICCYPPKNVHPPICTYPGGTTTTTQPFTSADF